jgi:transposase
VFACVRGSPPSPIRTKPDKGEERRGPASNQAERDLRPSKIQEKISGRLTSIDRAKDRYRIRGVLSTAIKHAVQPMTVLADAFRGKTWLPPTAFA